MDFSLPFCYFRIAVPVSLDSTFYYMVVLSFHSFIKLNFSVFANVSQSTFDVPNLLHHKHCIRTRYSSILAKHSVLLHIKTVTALYKYWFTIANVEWQSLLLLNLGITRHSWQEFGIANMISGFCS